MLGPPRGASCFLMTGLTGVLRPVRCLRSISLLANFFGLLSRFARQETKEVDVAGWRDRRREC